VAGRGPVYELLRLEPEGDFLLGGLDRVGTVDDVATEIDAEVTTDGAGKGSLRIRFAHHHSAGLGSVFSFPDHWDNWAGGHEVAETTVERLVLEIDVMLFDVFFGGLHKLHGNEFEATLLEPLDDVPNESALDTIGLHHDEGSFLFPAILFVFERKMENLKTKEFKQIETTQL